jgi:hypothetical protein
MKKTSALLFVCACAFALCGNAAPCTSQNTATLKNYGVENFAMFQAPCAVGKRGKVYFFNHGIKRLIFTEAPKSKDVDYNEGTGENKNTGISYSFYHFKKAYSFTVRNSRKPDKILIGRCEGCGEMETRRILNAFIEDAEGLKVLKRVGVWEKRVDKR